MKSALLLLGLGLAPAGSLDAERSGPGSTVPASDTVGAVVVHPDPGNPTVGLSVLVRAGWADDPDGAEGAARLLADALVLAHEGVGGVRLDAGVEGDFTVFTATAPAGRWEEAYDRLSTLLFEDPLPPDLVEAARERTLSRLAFEEGSPVQSFEQQLREAIHGPRDPWARPPRGTSEGVGALDLPVLEAIREGGYRREDAVVAVTGPMEPADVTDRVTGASVALADPEGEEPRTAPRDAELRAAGTVEGDQTTPSMDEAEGQEFAPARPAAGDPPAWSAGERITVDREVTSTWMAVALPVPPYISPLELAFLSEVVEDHLTPSPPDRDLYEIRTEARHLPDGPAVVVRATVFPVAAYEWERRILDGVEELGRHLPEGAFFDLARRSFQTERLLEDAAPGPRSRRLARELFEFGETGPATSGFDGLDRNRLEELGEALGPPRVLLYGPLDMARPVPTERGDDSEGG